MHSWNCPDWLTGWFALWVSRIHALVRRCRTPQARRRSCIVVVRNTNTMYAFEHNLYMDYRNGDPQRVCSVCSRKEVVLIACPLLYTRGHTIYLLMSSSSRNAQHTRLFIVNACKYV